MYTANLMFKSQLVEEEFDKLCDSHLSLIIDDVIKNYQKVVVNQIYFEGYNLNISLTLDGNEVMITSNFQKMEIIVSCNKWEYSICYDNHPQNLFKIKEFRYQKNNKILIKNNLINPDSKKDEYLYKLNFNNHYYNIHIIDYNHSYSEKNFIKYILDKNIIDIANVNELYIVIANSNDISKINIEITNQKNYDEIFIYDGEIVKYHFTYYEDDTKKEVYYKDNDFYQKVTSVKKLNKDNIYIKKMGGRYGRR